MLESQTEGEIARVNGLSKVKESRLHGNIVMTFVLL